MKLKRIGIWSFARISALLGVVFGLLFGLIIGIMFVSIPELALYLGNQGNTSALRMLVYMPLNQAITFGVINLIAGAIIASLYNFFAKFVGGIEIELAESKAKDKKK